MTREEAYNRIDAIIGKHEIDDEYVTVTNEKDYDALRLCRKVIEQEPRWIPVSERLPEKKGLYLVSVKNEHDRRYSKTCWFHGDDNWFARQDVIAWMPLPEPYKAEREE